MQRTGSPITDQVSRAIERRVDVLEMVPIVAGRIVEVTLRDGDWTRVTHGLGRRWRGYLEAGMTNDAGAGYIYARRTPGDDEHIELFANYATTDPQLLLWVF